MQRQSSSSRSRRQLYSFVSILIIIVCIVILNRQHKNSYPLMTPGIEPLSIDPQVNHLTTAPSDDDQWQSNVRLAFDNCRFC